MKRDAVKDISDSIAVPGAGLNDQVFFALADGPEAAANTQAAVALCLQRPQWRLSLQTHKLLGIP